jgi:molecular chaperone DnaJ
VPKKKKNFYKALNVRRNATPSEIKKAYRAGAKRYHPDVSSKDEEKFKQIQEAYETLSDPEKKIIYDEELKTERKPISRTKEPFVREDSFFNFFDRLDPFTNLKDAWSDFVSDFFFEEEQEKRHYVEITLTPEEAKKGGEISFELPFQIPCSRCLGTGKMGRLICGRCRGEGKETSEKKITIKVPPGIRDGMESRVPVDVATMPHFEIIATIRVSRY